MMRISLGLLGLSAFMLQACAYETTHTASSAVPVRIMGTQNQTMPSSPAVVTQPRVVASQQPSPQQPLAQQYLSEYSNQTIYSNRISTSDPVRRNSAPVAPVGQTQTVSVSPYEGRKIASQTAPSTQRQLAQQPINQAAQPVYRTSSPYVSSPTPSPTSLSTPPSTLSTPVQQQHTQPVVTTAASQAPVVPEKTHNLSITDVLDKTIREAPDLNVAPVAVKQTEPDTKTGAGQAVNTVPPTPSKGQGHQPSKQDIAKLGSDKPRFYWPVRGNIISAYGSKGSGKQNDGINISAPRGTAVKAAAAGLVVYSGEDLGGLGNLILIRHSGNYHTAYAHVDNKLVKTGDRVALGQAIANVGKSGNVTTPQLHFEIRDGKKPVNPDGFLPRS